MRGNARWFGMLLGGLLSAVVAGSEPSGYSLPWIAGPMEDLPYVASGQVDLDEGVLDLAAGQASLRSHAEVDDFELEFQWRTEAQQDGGTLLFGDRGQPAKPERSSGFSIDLTAGKVPIAKLPSAGMSATASCFVRVNEAPGCEASSSLMTSICGWNTNCGPAAIQASTFESPAVATITGTARVSKCRSWTTAPTAIGI